MKKRIISILFFVLSIFSVVGQQFSAETLLSDIAERKITPVRMPSYLPMNDGEYYTTLSADGKQIIKYAYKTGLQAGVILDVTKTKNLTLEKIEGYAFSADETRILVYNNVEKGYRHSFSAEYYVYDTKRNRLELLSENGKQKEAVFSPDGRMVAFARNNNLFIKRLDFGTEVAVTTDGETDKIVNGTPDWLYEEEFAVTQLYAWSPDSKCLAYVKLDESEVGEFAWQEYRFSEKEQYPFRTSIKYPKAGTKNPLATLYAYDVYYKFSKKIPLPDEADGYLPRIEWTNNEESLAVFKLNRNQNKLDVYFANPKSTIAKRILTETSDYYIDFRNLAAVRFLPDNKSFVFMSERDGYKHLYLYSLSGILLQKITNGKWDVTDFYGYDATKKIFYYQAAQVSPMGREIYAVDLKGKQTRISEAAGTNVGIFNKTFTYFVSLTEAADKVPQISMRTASGKSLYVIEHNYAFSEKLKTLPFAKKEFIQIKNSEGIVLNAWKILPKDFDAVRKYPVVVMQYSGPCFQFVLDEFDYGWEQYLATQGFVVIGVDVRGSDGRGEDFRKSTYLQLGQLEAKDLCDVAQYLATQSYIDKNRIGIYGWSYGGYAVLMGMSQPNSPYKAGVAVAPVTDWKLYDTAYTERYMRTPQDNFRGYALSSPIELADKLQGRLLLVHGTADDNVHLQNTLEYADALVKAGKQFDMQLYPNCNHSINVGNSRVHLYERMTQFFLDNLK